MGKKLTVYLIDGTDNSPRTIEIGNWSGKAIYTPRSNLLQLINRPEFEKQGVYILKSDPKTEEYVERIYIGEAEVIGKRLIQHINNPEKDFKECIIFTSKDDMLTKSHIKYIESRLVKLANEAKNSEIENGNIPNEPKLSEADISDMEGFIDQIKLILPIAGFQFLISNIVTNENKKRVENDMINSVKYYLKSKNISAELFETNEGYIVLKGSTSMKEESKSISENWIKMRKRFINSGILKDSGDKYEFMEDTIFSSLSAAAAIVLGRQAAGPNEWKDENGKSYKENNKF